MLNLESNRGVALCNGFTRRDFLRVGSLAVGLSLTELDRLQQLGATSRSSEKSCIQLFLIGGPSQLDTWDLKPHAPAEIRGPFRPIQTNVAGIQICEHFPRMAQRADRYAILRSVYHQEAPIHETGQQLLQTGRLFPNGVEWPHHGAVLSVLRPDARPVPSWALLPGPVRDTGVQVSHGQTAGFLGRRHGPFMPSQSILSVADRSTAHGIDPGRLESARPLFSAVDAAECAFEAEAVPVNNANAQAFSTIFSPQAKKAFDVAAERDSVRKRYGRNTFGQSCLLARRLVGHGVRLVTVNMFDTVFNEITWDCHANGGELPTMLDDYGTTLCPMFDQAYCALLDDLTSMGLLETTLVLAAGEFGRSPKLNSRNGRDHWPGVWSVLLAGGGVRGGQVIGASDRHAAEPKDRPIHAAEIAATVYHALGIDPQTTLPGPDGRTTPLVEAKPVLELF